MCQGWAPRLPRQTTDTDRSLPPSLLYFMEMKVAVIREISATDAEPRGTFANYKHCLRRPYRLAARGCSKKHASDTKVRQLGQQKLDLVR